ncbi:unnamed protein product [Protopolystoma xenopodis]|uniref:Uncharacterized protein n=1 Tax=Protopolystoma xenopodis TaxID=117903 RepID=A0A448XM54_9PLAT|nr:unnamed protein product [Protopolystoma xenopodis]
MRNTMSPAGRICQSLLGWGGWRWATSTPRRVHICLAPCPGWHLFTPSLHPMHTPSQLPRASFSGTASNACLGWQQPGIKL